MCVLCVCLGYIQVFAVHVRMQVCACVFVCMCVIICLHIMSVCMYTCNRVCTYSGVFPSTINGKTKRLLTFVSNSPT